jgi:uroporphyrin-3 C-methyltransferase
VDKLSQQSITMTVPETLQSQALLEKLMQTRAQPDGAACRYRRAARRPLHLLHRPPLRRKESNAC